MGVQPRNVLDLILCCDHGCDVCAGDLLGCHVVAGCWFVCWLRVVFCPVMLLLALSDAKACPQALVHGRCWKDSLAPPGRGEVFLRGTPTTDSFSTLQKTCQCHVVRYQSLYLCRSSTIQYKYTRTQKVRTNCPLCTYLMYADLLTTSSRITCCEEVWRKSESGKSHSCLSPISDNLC